MTMSSLRMQAVMTTLERLLNGEFIHPSTWFGVIFYALVFLALAWVGFRSLRIALEQLEGRAGKAHELAGRCGVLRHRLRTVRHRCVSGVDP